MTLVEKCQQWREKLKKGKGGDIEWISFDERREVFYRAKNILSPVDCFFLCHRENGKRTAEIIYRRNDDCSTFSTEQVFIKDMQKEMPKVIFIDKNGQGHAFGYDETDKDQSFVMYIRIGRDARLMWAHSAGSRVNCAVEENLDNPTDLDCLIDFMQIGTTAEQTIDKEGENNIGEFDKRIS